MRNNKLETTEWIMEAIMAWRRKIKRERETVGTKCLLQGEMNKKYESMHSCVYSAMRTFGLVKHTVYTSLVKKKISVCLHQVQIFRLVVRGCLQKLRPPVSD